jgi:hypothetical protein
MERVSVPYCGSQVSDIVRLILVDTDEEPMETLRRFGCIEFVCHSFPELLKVLPQEYQRLQLFAVKLCTTFVMRMIDLGAYNDSFDARCESPV